MGLVSSGKAPKPLQHLLNYSRKYSLWMFQWGLACCAIEMGAALAGPEDVDHADDTVVKHVMASLR